MTLTYRRKKPDHCLPPFRVRERQELTLGHTAVVTGLEPESRGEDQSPGLVTLSYLGRVPAYTLGSLRWSLRSIPASIIPSSLYVILQAWPVCLRDKLCPAGSSSAWPCPYALGRGSCNLPCISTVHCVCSCLVIPLLETPLPPGRSPGSPVCILYLFPIYLFMACLV